jgi:hypothetical protein
VEVVVGVRYPKPRSYLIDTIGTSGFSHATNPQREKCGLYPRAPKHTQHERLMRILGMESGMQMETTGNKAKKSISRIGAVLKETHTKI